MQIDELLLENLNYGEKTRPIMSHRYEEIHQQEVRQQEHGLHRGQD